MRRPGNNASAGLTLAELVVTLAIVSTLLTAMGSVIVIASRAIDSGAGPLACKSTAGTAVAEVVADLQMALGFTERTATAATFTVPDRDGDGSPETIRYAWSGTQGDPLTRAVNGGAAVVLADDVHQFDLTYLTKILTPLPPADPPEPETQESDELLLISHDDAPGGQFSTQSIQKKKWVGQYFQPTLPTNTTSWKITRVQFVVQEASGAQQDLDVDIQTSDTNQKPTGVVLQQVVVARSALPDAYDWHAASFSSVGDLDPASGFCLVLSATGKTADVQYETNGSPMTANTHYLYASNEGNWDDPDNTRDLRFRVYGTVTTEGEPQWP